MTKQDKRPDALEEYRRLLGDLPTGIAGSIELVAGQISEQAQSLLRLGAIPHSLDKEIVAVLMPEATTADLEAAAQELRPLSFVFQTSEGSMLHDEVRAYLFAQWLDASETDADKWGLFEATSAHLANYYGDLHERVVGEAQAVAERQRVFHLIGADREQGYAEFEKVCRAERYRYRLGSCEALIKLVREYSPILSDKQRIWLRYHEAKLLMDMRHHEEGKGSFQRLVQDSTSSGDDALKARSLFRLASVLRETRDFEKARVTFFELRSFIAGRPAAADQELRTIQGLASLLIEMGWYKEAEQMLGEVLELARQKEDRSALAVYWNSVGNLYRKLGNPRRSLEAFRGALKELEQGEEVYRPRQVYNNIGLLHADRAEWSEARENLEMSLEIARKSGDLHGEGVALSNLGRVYLALSMPGEALAAAERSIGLFIEVHNWYGAAMTSRGLARFYRREGRIEESRAAFMRAREFFQRAGATKQAEQSEAEAERLDNRRKPWGWIKWTLAIVAGLVLAFLLLALIGYLIE